MYFYINIHIIHKNTYIYNLLYIFGLVDRIRFLNQVLFHQLRHDQVIESHGKSLNEINLNPFVSNQDPNSLRIEAFC